MKFMNPLRKALLFLIPAMILGATPVLAAPGFDAVGNATVKEIGSYAMTPVPARQIPDGVYEVEVVTSSSFFRVEKTLLTVEDGEMSACMYMYSSSYSHVYPGTAEEAAGAAESEYIPSEEKDYYATFTIPVKNLNEPLPCAAFSKKKQKWYDRNILVMASSLPEGVLGYDLPDYDLVNRAIEEYKANHPDSVPFFEGEKDDALPEGYGSVDAEEPEGVTLDLPDGEYSIETILSGGSGRASVTSPTWFYVKNGEAYAKLLWSSTYYDYMLVEGHKYLNETTDGSNSTFTIPVTVMDEPMSIVADTTAMGDPLEISYTLTFYRDTIGAKSKVPQEGAKRVIVIALIFMVGGGIVNHLVKTRRKR